MKIEESIRRFYNLIMPEPMSGCWLWAGGLAGNRYGAHTMPVNGKRKTLLAHRISYQLHKGEIPDGLIIRHTCDNTACVNPDHLETGTQKENIQDKIRRGRVGRTGKNSVKHSDETVLKAIELKSTGLSYDKVRELTGVSPGNLCQIIKGKSRTDLNIQNRTL